MNIAGAMKNLSPRRKKKKQLQSKRHKKKIQTMLAVTAVIWTVRVVMEAKVLEAAWVVVGVVEEVIEMIVMTKKNKKRILVKMLLFLSSNSLPEIFTYYTKA